MRVLKKHKQPQGQGPRRSIDGIIGSNPRLGVPLTRSYQPGRDLAGLSSAEKKPSEGFHPLRSSTQPLGAAAGAAGTDVSIDEPVMLDDQETKKEAKPSQTKRPWRSKLKRYGKVLGVLIILFGAYFGIKLYVTSSHIFRGGGKAPALASSIDINQLKGEGDGRINILLLGIGGPEQQNGPDLTDTILLASIDPINKKAALLSIPRDLWVKIPGDGNHKLNEAYFWGKQNSKAKNESQRISDGINSVDKTLEAVLGIPIHYHVLIDYAGFRQAIDAVGGVDINVPKNLSVYEQLWDESTGSNYVLNVPAGQQHLDGRRALFFSRSRYTSARGDFDRAERQRLVLVVLRDKVLSLGTFANPVKVSQLLDSFGNNVYTDFQTSEISRVRQIATEIPSSAIGSLDLVTPPNDLLTTTMLDDLSIVAPKTGSFDYAALQNYVRNALRDSFLANENASVAVFNATSKAGLATSAANNLKSYGYNVTAVDNAPTTNPASTIVVDQTKGVKKYTKHYLEERFKTTAIGSLPPGLPAAAAGADFVIILGQNTQ